MNEFNRSFFEGGFGLERETLRVDKNGRLSQSPHCFDNPKLGRDFCESQLEIITSVSPNVKGATNELKKLSKYAEEKLKKHGEYIWKYSNPPRIESDDEIVIAAYAGEDKPKYLYRKKLEEKYGKRLMVYSGIHFNFSLSEEYLRSICDGKNEFSDFKNRLYFRLMKQCFRYSWLPVLLTAASPFYDCSIEDKSATAFSGIGSTRNSVYGYWNKFVPVLDYSDLQGFVDSVNSYVESGWLLSPAELYLPVRLKPRGTNSLEKLLSGGIDHIELRMFDLNPLSDIGIFTEDLEFTHYFLMYLLSLPDFEFSAGLQQKAVQNHKAAAEYDISKMIINDYPATEAAMGLLEDMSIFYDGCSEIIDIIEIQKNKITDNKRYCLKIYEKYEDNWQREILNEIKGG